MALRIPLAAVYRGAATSPLVQLSLPELRGSGSVKTFFTSSTNKLSSFINRTKGVDKAVKAAAAVTELSRVIAMRTGAAEAVAGASTALGLFTDARSVIGLANALNGSIPAMVDSGKNCKTLVMGLIKKQSFVAIGAKEDPQDGNESRVSIVDYNRLYCGRGEMALGLVDHACGLVSSATYVTAFGPVRGTLFANRCSSFMAPPVKQGFSQAFNWLMAVNHAAGLIGSSCALVHENKAYRRVLESCDLVAESGEALDVTARPRLKMVHQYFIIGHVVNLMEKLMEMILDIFKIIPSIVSILPLEAKAALGVLIGFIGLYKIWRTA
ncbi:MAG: hypothetical protein RR519_01160 [Victivallaceae bacterium]